MSLGGPNLGSSYYVGNLTPCWRNLASARSPFLAHLPSLGLEPETSQSSKWLEGGGFLNPPTSLFSFLLCIMYNNLLFLFMFVYDFSMCMCMCLFTWWREEVFMFLYYSYCVLCIKMLFICMFIYSFFSMYICICLCDKGEKSLCVCVILVVFLSTWMLFACLFMDF